MNIKIKTADIVIIIFFFLLSTSVFAFFTIKSEQGKIAIIKTPDGVFEYSLNKDRRLVFKGKISDVIIEIKNGKIGFIYSGCPKKICLDFGFFNQSGAMAASVPNRISVYIKSTKSKKQVDVICR